MMVIDANTRLNVLFKFNQGALEAIVGLNAAFMKLRNPFLRKLMAPRTSISMAAKIGGCSPSDFFNVLEPLGFTVSELPLPETTEKTYVQDKKNITPSVSIDARPILSAGGDPLREIMDAASALRVDETLLVINSFEPLPLTSLLEKKGFSAWTEKQGEQLYHTYFKRLTETVPVSESSYPTSWDDATDRFHNEALHLDVREMQAPLPMVTILEELDQLPAGKALYVHHKRIPLYLLPELRERGFEYRIKEVNKNEVHILIFLT